MNPIFSGFSSFSKIAGSQQLLLRIASVCCTPVVRGIAIMPPDFAVAFVSDGSKRACCDLVVLADRGLATLPTWGAPLARALLPSLILAVFSHIRCNSFEP